MDKTKDQYERLREYVVKNETYGQKVKDSIMPSLMQAIEKFSVTVKEQKIAQKHKDYVMAMRIHRKMVDREKEKQKLRDELKGEMGDDYEEEDEEGKDDDEDSFLDEEEKEFYDRGRIILI